MRMATSACRTFLLAVMARSPNVVGTGKYEGMVASGTVRPLGPFPVIKAGTFQDCNHQSGTYELK